MIDIFREKILRFLGHKEYTPIKLNSLAKALGISDEQFEDFKAAYKQLRTEGRVIAGGKKLLTISGPKGVITGKFQGNPKGFGFVVPLERHSHEDLFISPSDTNGAMTGDIVSVRVIKKGFRGGKMAYSGQVIEIVERGHSQFVGTLSKATGQWLAKPDGSTVVEPIAVDDVGAKGAKENDKVVVEILSYPESNKLGRGVIVEVLGKAGKYETEIKAVIQQHGLPTDFTEKCIDQARNAAGEFEKWNADPPTRRDDITDKVIITIDPETAKDFDDAISLNKTKDGNWELGVHIADVSTFIPMESSLDIEARKRGNSVYLPSKTIPMLPEILSNGICSLQPDQPRFAKTVYITYDPQGKVIDRNYANSLIKSTARLSYEEAEFILKGKAGGFAGEVVALLKDMETLARAIEARRVKNGMLHLDLPETEIEFDDDGQAIDAHPADDSYPHTMIEMFMVEANEAVAALFDRYDIPFMRRIHPEPDILSTKNLSRFVRICGMKVPKKLDRAAMQDLIHTVKGTPAEFAINLHVLRSLSKAEYSPLHIGHFALSSGHYCHFTSPIRRYADLMIHRLLQVYLEQRLNQIGIEEVLPEAELKEIGKHITFTEQRADGAEKEVKKVLVLELLSKKIGDELEGAVSGLTNFGIFVHCYKYGIEGMIEINELGFDEWRIDDRSGAVIGEMSGKRIDMGSPMKVRIVAVNIPARQLSLAPIKPLVESRGELFKPGKKNRPMSFSDRKPKRRKKRKF